MKSEVRLKYVQSKYKFLYVKKTTGGRVMGKKILRCVSMVLTILMIVGLHPGNVMLSYADESENDEGAFELKEIYDPVEEGRYYNTRDTVSLGLDEDFIYSWMILSRYMQSNSEYQKDYSYMHDIWHHVLRASDYKDDLIAFNKYYSGDVPYVAPISASSPAEALNTCISQYDGLRSNSEKDYYINKFSGFLPTEDMLTYYVVSDWDRQPKVIKDPYGGGLYGIEGMEEKWMNREVTIFYDFKFDIIEVDSTRQGLNIGDDVSSEIEIRNGINSQSSAFQAINPNLSTIEVSKGYTYTKSQELSHEKSSSVEFGFSNSLTAGLEVSLPTQIVSGKVENTFNYSFNTAEGWSSSETRTTQEEVVDSISVPLPPHTTIEILEKSSTSQVTVPYSGKAVMTYKVAVFRMHGMDPIFAKSYLQAKNLSFNTPIDYDRFDSQVYPVVFLGKENGDAIDDFDQRLYISKKLNDSGASDPDKIDWYNSFGENWKNDGAEIENLKYIRYAPAGGKFNYSATGTTISPGVIQPLYNLKNIIPETENITMYEGESYELDSINLKALNAYDVDYYGFKKRYSGSWKIVDIEGNEDNKYASIESGLNGNIIQANAEGLTYLQYVSLPMPNVESEEKGDMIDPVNSYLIPIRIHPTLLSDLRLIGELEPLYLNETNNEVNLSGLTVEALNEDGERVTPTASVFMIEETEGIVLSNDGMTATVNTPGIYHIYAVANGLISNRITQTVFAERALDTMTVTGQIPELIWDDPGKNSFDLASILSIEGKDQYGDHFEINANDYEWLIGSTNTNDVKSVVNDNILTGKVVGLDTVTLKVDGLYSNPFIYTIKGSPYIDTLFYGGNAPAVKPGFDYDLSYIDLFARDQYGSAIILSDEDKALIDWKLAEESDHSATIENGKLIVADDLASGDSSTIILKATYNGDVKTCISGDIVLTVKAQSILSSLEISAPEGLEMKLNENVNLSTFRLLGFDQYHDEVPVSMDEVVWTTSKPSVIEVSNEGTLIGKKIDQPIVLIATMGDVRSNELTMMVYGKRTLTNISIVGAPLNAYLGHQLNLTSLSVKCTDQYGKKIGLGDIPGEIVWSVQKMGTTATINKDGILEYGNNAGTFTLKASIRNTDSGVLVSDLLGITTINLKSETPPPIPPPPAPIPASSVSITIDENPVELEYGLGADEDFLSYDLIETITGSTDTNVEWTILDPEVATVNQNGVVMAVKQGETIVTVRHIASGATASSKVIVFLIGQEKSPLGAVQFFDPYILGYPDQSFGPQRPVTRAEVATIFSRILGLNLDFSSSPKYNDVSESTWYFKYIQASTRAGLFSGYDDGSFKPNAPITRGEIAAVVSKYWDYINVEVNTLPTNALFDVDGSHWASEYIYKMYNAGIVKGFENGSYRPNSNTLREQVVVMINTLIGRPQFLPEKTKYIDITKNHWAFGNIEAATTPYSTLNNLPILDNEN
jgi:hypothetical protein